MTTCLLRPSLCSIVWATEIVALSSLKPIFAMIPDCNIKAKVNFAMHRQRMLLCGSNTDYQSMSEAVTYTFVHAHIMQITFFFLQTDTLSHVVRCLFFLVLPWWCIKVSQRSSLPRPCARACMCALQCSTLHLAADTKRMFRLGNLSQPVSTALCVCVWKRSMYLLIHI